MAEARSMPGFALESGYEPGVGPLLRAEQLNRDHTIQDRIGSPPHSGHATDTEHLLELVPAREYPGPYLRHKDVSTRLVVPLTAGWTIRFSVR
jgi:hypothetical protein